MARVKELKVNGAVRRIDADPERSLLSVLRDDLDLTGSKYGCGEGKCGACTVLIDGEPARSCTARVGNVANRAITTIEGIEGPGGKLHPLQQAFLDMGAMQCGYCTPGMIVAGAGLLARTAKLAEQAQLTEVQIAEAMQGNVCRCGTYSRIVAAIQRAAATVKGGAR